MPEHAATDSTTIDHHFDVTEPLLLVVENGRGSVEVIATDTDRASVVLSGPDAAETRVDLHGSRLSVLGPEHRGLRLRRDPELHVRAVVPTGSDLRLDLGSADLVATGTYKSGQVNSGSGDVTVERFLREAIVSTGSGAIQVDRCEGPSRLRTGSGEVRVDHAAELRVATGSGDVRIGVAEGPVQIKTGSGSAQVASSARSVVMATGSGDLRVDVATAGAVQLKAASGGCRIGIPHGTPVWTDVSTLSGQVRSDLPSTGAPTDGRDHVEVRVVTVSGDVELRSV